jgi:hypothetical protein
MKKFFTAILSLAALSMMPVAHADYNTAARDGKVTCTGKDVTVSINAERTEITVRSSYDPGHPEKYEVSDTNTDGDTMIEYLTLSNDEGTHITLSFDDQGDSMTSDSGREALRCPK